jgi:hypothetical protein
MTERLRTIIIVYAVIVATLAWGFVLCSKTDAAERLVTKQGSTEHHAEVTLGPCAKWPREEPCPTDDPIMPTVGAGSGSLTGVTNAGTVDGRSTYGSRGADEMRLYVTGKDFSEPYCAVEQRYFTSYTSTDGHYYAAWPTPPPPDAKPGSCCKLVVVPCETSEVKP